MLTAHAELQIRASLASLRRRDLNEPSNPVDIK